MAQRENETVTRLSSISFGPRPVTIIAGPGVSLAKVDEVFGRSGERIGAAVSLSDVSSTHDQQLLIVYQPAEVIAAEAMRSERDVRAALEDWRSTAKQAVALLSARRRSCRLVGFDEALCEPEALGLLLGRPVSVRSVGDRREDAPSDLFEVLGRYAVLNDPATARISLELEAACVVLGGAHQTVDIEAAAQTVRALEPNALNLTRAEAASEIVSRLVVDELQIELKRRVSADNERQRDFEALRAANRELLQQSAGLQEAHGKLASEQSALRDRYADLALRQKDLRASYQKLEARWRMADQRRASLELKNQEVIEERDELKASEELLHQTNDALEQAIAQTRQSRSWLFSLPVRVVGRLLRWLGVKL